MLSEKLISQSYVQKDDCVYSLLYFINWQAKEKAKTVYGITIKQCSDELTCSESAVVSDDRDRVLELVNDYARNFVFPISLSELIEDLNYKANSISAN